MKKETIDKFVRVQQAMINPLPSELIALEEIYAMVEHYESLLARETPLSDKEQAIENSGLGKYQ